MIDLTLLYRLIYKNGLIVNPDYKVFQTGHTYPAFDLQSKEFNILDEMMQFISDNNLIETDWFNFDNPPIL